MPKASYDGAAMANVCRPLQNGLPALRFAVIRGFWLLLLELGSEPARVVFRLRCFSSTHQRLRRRILVAAWTFPIPALAFALCIRQRRRRATRQESRAGTVVVDRTAA